MGTPAGDRARRRRSRGRNPSASATFAAKLYRNVVEGNGQGTGSSKNGIVLSYTAGSASGTDYVTHLDGNSVRGTDVSVLGSDCSGQDVRLDNNLLDTAVDFGSVTFKQGQNVIAGAAVVAPNDGAPASATAPGQPGEVRYDASYCYVCVAADTWRRFATETFESLSVHSCNF